MEVQLIHKPIGMLPPEAWAASIECGKKLEANAIGSRRIDPPCQIVLPVCKNLDHTTVYEYPELNSILVLQ